MCHNPLWSHENLRHPEEFRAPHLETLFFFEIRIGPSWPLHFSRLFSSYRDYLSTETPFWVFGFGCNSPQSFQTLKDVFHTMLNCGHFWASLFSRCFHPIMNFGHFWPLSPLTFHNVKNHGGVRAEGEGRIAGERRTKEHKENNTQRKTKTNRNEQERKTLGAGQTM